MKLKPYQAILQAGETRTIHATGDYFRLMIADYDIRLAIGEDENTILLKKGQGVIPGQFKSLRITNTGADPQTIDYVIGGGGGRVLDDTINGTIAATLVASTVFSTISDLTVNGLTEIAAVNASRKAITIAAAPGNTANVKVGDASTGAARGLTLQPGQSVTLSTTAAVYGYADAQKVEVLEV
jgi:hypothetical protein